MNLALFGFDGTITNREMFSEFLHFSVEPRRFALGRTLLAPLIAGQRCDLVSGGLVRALLVRLGYCRVPVERIESHGILFADYILPRAVRPEATERIRWHQSRGDTVVVVSDVLDIYLTHWCRKRGIDLVCSSLEHRSGLLTGRFEGAQCVGGEKPRRVMKRYDLSRYRTIYAYGDSREDLDLLAIADRKFYRWQELPASSAGRASARIGAALRSWRT